MISNKKLEFIEKHKTLSEEDYKLELLYSQQMIYSMLNRVRRNLSVIVWMIAIFIILYIIGSFMDAFQQY